MLEIFVVVSNAMFLTHHCTILLVANPTRLSNGILRFSKKFDEDFIIPAAFAICYIN